MISISILNDYTIAPGPRYIWQGDFSGELFRKDILKPKYLEAKQMNDKVFVDFDGTYGYFDSFLEEAFGGLAREFKDDNIRPFFEFKSDEDESVLIRVEKYIREAKQDKNK